MSSHQGSKKAAKPDSSSDSKEPLTATEHPRVVCLVPSITETLLFCGINVVGRSRFCIHPENTVAKIKKVGGTKDVDWQKVAALQPDWIILDKEENTKEMAEACPFAYVALHIQSINDVAPELTKLAQVLDSSELLKVAERWQALSQLKQTTAKHLESTVHPLSIPAVIEWWRQPDTQQTCLYLIWRSPWMAAGKGIFIQSVLDLLQIPMASTPAQKKYPVIDLENYRPQDTILLCSSEPYPFAQYREEIMQLGYACALVDGEKYSWYGIRSLSFLEQELAVRNLSIPAD